MIEKYLKSLIFFIFTLWKCWQILLQSFLMPMEEYDNDNGIVKTQKFESCWENFPLTRYYENAVEPW